MDVMIVEDEIIIQLATAHMVESLGHQVLARIQSAEDALERLERQTPDLILMDIHLDGPMDGIEAGAIIRDRWKVPLAYASAYTDGETLRRAAETEPVAFLAKPVTLENFRELFDQVDC